jgi:type II secretory pathway pseudopilin PulG
MKKNGFSLVEIIVFLAVIFIIVTLSFLMFFGANKQSRDVKRISDINVLRSSMAAIKVQYGSYLQSGCQLGSVYNCYSGKLAEVMRTVNNFKDPKGKNLCIVDCNSSCEYSFEENMTDDHYEVLFYLEKGVGNYSEKGCYSLTENGIDKKSD